MEKAGGGEEDSREKVKRGTGKQERKKDMGQRMDRTEY